MIWIFSVAALVFGMRTVIIEVSGGVVQEVYSDDQVRVVLIDWDAGESPGDAFEAGEMIVQPFVTMPSETRHALGTVE
jgi:hypothetical protein